jgi:hypothetical protein
MSTVNVTPLELEVEAELDVEPLVVPSPTPLVAGPVVPLAVAPELDAEAAPELALEIEDAVAGRPPEVPLDADPEAELTLTVADGLAPELEATALVPLAADEPTEPPAPDPVPEALKRLES